MAKGRERVRRFTGDTVKFTLPPGQEAQFHELAAQFEFVDGLPRKLAEKKALESLAEVAAPVPKPADGIGNILAKVRPCNSGGRPYLGLMAAQRQFIPQQRRWVENKRLLLVPKASVDAGAKIYIGGRCYRATWHATDRIQLSPV